MPTLGAMLLSDELDDAEKADRTKRKKNKTVTLTSSPHAVINFGKGGRGSGRVAGYGMLDGKPGRKSTREKSSLAPLPQSYEDDADGAKAKRKRKSITLGKNADWSSGQASQSAWSASDKANVKGSAKAHAKAAASHRHAADLAGKAGNFGTQKMHLSQARIHDGKADKK